MATKSNTHRFELPPDAMRNMVNAAMRRIVEHIATLGAQPMHATAGGRKLAASLREPLPEDGTSFDRLLRLLFGRVIPHSLNTASPGYLAYVPGGGLFHAAVADLIADAVNRYVGVWLAAPGLVQLETNVVQWLREIATLPPLGGGVLTTGGSMANLIAVVAARRERLPPEFLAGVLYTSEEAHHSVGKSALVAGLPPQRVRSIASDERFRMRLDLLEQAIATDRAAGLQPFMVVASAGTTNTGGVDDLEGIARICRAHNLWMHVDAAYGGFFMLTARGRQAMKGLGEADSVTLDPHKGLFLPYGTGALVVRDPQALRRAFQMHASYLPPMQDAADRVDFCDLSFELSRDARGLRVWLPMKMHGAAAFREALDEKLDLAHDIAERLRLLEGVELIAPPELSLLAFRVKPKGLSDGEAIDRFNRKLLSAINERQRVLLTGTVTHGMFLIRICVLSFRTHRDRMDMCFDDIRAALAEVRAHEAG